MCYVCDAMSDVLTCSGVFLVLFRMKQKRVQISLSLSQVFKGTFSSRETIALQRLRRFEV